MIAFLLNIIWVVLGGFVMFLGWMLAGVIMVVTIIGIPWARSAFTIGFYALWPFGREAVDRAVVTGRQDIGTGALGVLGNIIWFVLAGWWLALGHLLAALALVITIIGIPMAWAHVKLAAVSLFPIGKVIVDKGRAGAWPSVPTGEGQ